MDADAEALLGREPVEHLVIQADEALEQRSRGIELQREARFREIDLHAVGAQLQTFADVGGRLLDQIQQERLARIAGDVSGGIKQTEGRGRDHRLFSGNAVSCLAAARYLEAWTHNGTGRR